MSNTTIPDAIAEAPVRGATRPRPHGAFPWLRKNVVEPLASLRLTVTLFALSIFLVFASTLALIDAGLFTVLDSYFRTWGIAWIPFQAFVRLGQVFFFVPKDVVVPGSFPYPGGWLLGTLLLLNLLAAHALRFRFTWKDLILLPAFVLGALLLWMWQEQQIPLGEDESLFSWLLLRCGASALGLSMIGLVWFHGKRGGVILLHLGLIIMLLSEAVTGLFAVEQTMTIAEGETATFLDLSRKTELAIIDRSNPKMDDVVVIPESRLRERGWINYESLPFDVEVTHYMPNSALTRLGEGETNPATVGSGLRFIARERKEVSGTDTNQAKEVASAYVTFRKKNGGEALGTYLVSLFFDTNFNGRAFPEMPQTLTVDGKPYEVFLRPERVYLPYQVQLLEFRHDKYLGTNVPKNYSSKVRLIDPEHHEERVVKISMNQPLRFAGETFYQSGVLGGQKGTILQVVHNPGWLMPYVSCVLVALGMVIHFGGHLVAFLRRRALA